MTQAAAVEARTGAAGAGVATGNLRLRLLFHLAHKEGKEQALLSYHQRLSQSSQGGTGQGAREDQMSLAAMHFGRSHFQEATDIYKRLLLENREDLALNAYIALCYYKLDYYDVSLEILAVYLQARPLSPAAINLKACNHFRLFNGKAAEAELKALGDHSFLIEDSALMRHNLVVFRNGEGSLRVLPPLVGVVPEARLNLVIFHLRQGAVADAYALIKDLEPSIPQEYILKAVVNAAVGQRASSREHLKTSQQYYNLVGASASECDTIPGRQCMASCFFLRRQFEDVQIYLSSIKPYLYNGARAASCCSATIATTDHSRSLAPPIPPSLRSNQTTTSTGTTASRWLPSATTRTRRRRCCSCSRTRSRPTSASSRGWLAASS